MQISKPMPRRRAGRKMLPGMMRRAALRLIALFTLLVMALPAARAETGDVSHFRLENGLELVVIENHRAPVVVHMVWYRVGAADEAPGKSGIAHLFEHLMFKGTDKYPEGAFSRLIEAEGGMDNAFTTHDYTAYFQRIAADRLPLVMALEADRMRNLRLSEEDVETEKKVVLEERNQRTDSDPGALFREQRMAVQYLNHPYGRPVIGWRHEVAALAREDALRFYRTYYAPNNATVVVVGDVIPEKVRALAEQHYGLLAPSADLPPRRRPQEPPHLAERRLEMHDARVARPYVIRTYYLPPEMVKDRRRAAALTMFAELLGGGATSRLTQALVNERKIALSTAAFADVDRLDSGIFMLYAVPTPGTSLADMEKALDDEVAAFIERGIDPDDLARARTRVKAAVICGRDSMMAEAREYGAALSLGRSVEDVRRWPELLADVSDAEILAAGRAALDRRRAVTGYLAPKAAQDAGTNSEDGK